jgi:hypothetical protein
MAAAEYSSSRSTLTATSMVTTLSRVTACRAPWVSADDAIAGRDPGPAGTLLVVEDVLRVRYLPAVGHLPSLVQLRIIADRVR